MQLSLETLCNILNVQPNVPCAGHDIVITHAAYDSREVTPKALFVAIKGAQVDGHNYASQAAARGATVILAEHEIQNLTVPQLIVPNSVQALGQIAHYCRMHTKAKVISLTGTSGKTTVKEALRSVLSQKGLTRATILNQNTQIGLPCSILSCTGDEDFWVMECGISHEGDMDALGEILEPDVALIINVGEGHTEGLGDKGVSWHKTRLLLHLKQGGQGIISGDYQDLVWKAIATHLDNLTFFSAKEGVQGQSSYTAKYLGAADAKYGRFLITFPTHTFEVRAPFLGEYGAENCIAVACTAAKLGVTDAEIQQGFLELKLPPQRFNQMQVKSWTIIDDSYNANPLSMRRMLQAARPKDSAFIAVLGEMRELGELSSKLHQQLGEQLADLQPTALFWKGGHVEDVEKGLAKANSHIAVRKLSTVEQFEKDLNSLFQAKDLAGTVIFKGSRANRLEQYVPVFQAFLANKD